MHSLKNKKVVVVGLGRSGVAAAGFAARRGAEVTVTDVKSEQDLGEQLRALSAFTLRKRLGGHDASAFEGSDLVVVSPGVALGSPGIAEARRQGIPVVGEMELALGEIAKPIIAVTGTNGKTTTTQLIGHLLGACGIAHCVGGNVGTPLTSLVARASEVDWVVVEVSSFQLETTPSLKPAIAVWLNATPDHLDRHRSFEAYVETKARLFAPLTAESWGIYNAADEVVRNTVIHSKATLIPFDAAHARADGGWYEDGDLWTDIGSRGRYRFGLQKVSLEGRHNRENMLAAILTLLIAGGNVESLQEGLESFRGLSHRMEFVREVGGVRFYDDSKGTNVGATVRALDSFAEPVVLIAGGQDKGADFSQLVPFIKRAVKRMILIGESADAIHGATGDVVPTQLAATMEEAVRLAWDAAEPGDVVLLSPACASFDMFKDYAERGDVFQQAVKTVAGKRRRRLR